MFLPENIDLAYPEKYRISIRLTPDGFSFSIYSPADPRIFHHQQTNVGNKLSYIESIKKLIFDAGFFSHSFQKTFVTVVSGEYTLMPDFFFEKNEITDVFNFNFVKDKGKVFSSHLKEQDCHVLFDMDEDLHGFFSRSLWNPIFRHHSEMLIPAFAAHCSESPEKRCYVNFHDNFVSVFTYAGTRLLSANTFNNSNRFDALYFIAGIWEKLPLDQSTDLLFLSGTVSQHSETVSTLKKLIRKTVTMNLSPKTQISENERALLPTDILVEL